MTKAKRNLLLVILSSMLAGGCASVLVQIGYANDWEGFSHKTGYFGAHWFDSALYAMGGANALKTVTLLWFVYAFSCTFLIFSAVLLFRNNRR